MKFKFMKTFRIINDCLTDFNITLTLENKMNNELFEYEIDNDSVTITKYIGNQADVVIPAEIDGMPVMRIGRRAFADCVFVATVVLPDEQMEIAEDAFDNCPNAEFFAADPNWDNESTETSNEFNSSDSNEYASENTTFDFDFTKNSDQNYCPAGPKYKMSLNRSELTWNDFRQSFSPDYYLFPDKCKGALSKMADSLFANLLAVMFYSLIVFCGTFLLALAASELFLFVTTGAFTVADTGAMCVIDALDASTSVNMMNYSFSLLIASLIFLSAFLTGFIRIMFAMTLKRPYSWKLLFSGFDFSFWKISLMWVLFYANVVCGFLSIALSGKANFPPQYVILPVVFINIPIAYFLIATIVLLACKRVSIIKSINILFSCSISGFKNIIFPNILGFILALVAMLVGGLFIYFINAGLKNIFATDFSPFISGAFIIIPMIWCIPMLFYYVAFLVKICPDILDNNVSESEIQPQNTHILSYTINTIVILLLAAGLFLVGNLTL